MSDDATARLMKLEQSLGGPDGAPLLIGCDEPPSDIAEAMECMEPDVEYRICVREFQGADTYIITKRSPVTDELAVLERLMQETGPQGEEDDGEPETGEDGGDGD